MTQKSPEPDDKSEGWLQRLLRRRPKHGDTLAVQIGDNAQSNAAGKNIIQIIGNTLNIPPALVVAILVALVILAAAGLVSAYYNFQTANGSWAVVTTLNATPTPVPTATPTPLPFLPATTNETLIVIARFHKTVANTEPEMEIFNAIDDQLRKSAQESVRVEVDSNTELAADQRAAAEALGNRYKASIVIWGADTGVRVVVNFLNLRQPELPAADVRINETARSQLASPSEYVQFITADLPAQLAFLSLFAVGQSYYLDAQYDQAINVVEAAVSLRDQSKVSSEGMADAYYLLGWLYQDISNLDKAVASYDDAINLNPQYAEAYNGRGVATYVQGEMNKAVADFRQATALDPEFAIAHHNLGNALFARGEISAALISIQRAVELAPRDPIYQLSLAGAMEEAGDYAAAAQAYRAAIDFDPEFARAYSSLGRVLLEQGQLDEAEEILQRGLAIQPTRPSLHKNLGRVFLGQGKLEAASAELQQAVDLSPAHQQPELVSQSPDLVFYDALYYLAVTYQQLGKTAGACAALDEYGRVASNDTDTKRPGAVQDLHNQMTCP
jgi:tetratricopeptide (TPR) repeat protein